MVNKKHKGPLTSMKLLIALLITITLFGMFVSFADERIETGPPKVGDTAPDFLLQDVDEKEHSLKKLQGKVVFLIMGNRKIRKEDDKWAEAFQKDYQEITEVTAYIIADLRSVPGFIPKGFIKIFISKLQSLDWRCRNAKGVVHETGLGM